MRPSGSVRVQLERVLPVLERVGRADRLGRQLAGPPRRARTRSRARSAIAAPRMKPRASAPSTRSGLRCAAPVRQLLDRLRRAPRGSASSGMTSLKPTPGCGQSGTSRIFVVEIHRAHAYATSRRRARQKRSCDSSWRASPSDCEVLEPGLPPLGIARAERGRDELLEQAGLAVGGRPERCAGAAARCRSCASRPQASAMSASRSRVALLPALDPRREQPELLELAREPSRRCRRARTELAEVELGSSLAAGRRRGGASAHAPPARRAPGGSPAAAGTRRAAAGGSSRSRSTSSSLKSR